MVTGEMEVRKDSEELIVRSLRKNNQVAFTIPEVFGDDGLKGLDEERVYLSLCDEGVDAVLVVAPVHFEDQPKQEFTHPLARNAYYFHRIWSYSTLHAPLTGRKQDWEAILFDLPTLSPHHVSSWSGISAAKLSRQLTALLLRDGVLKNPPDKKAF
jgi:hypothetical protein